MKSIEQLRKLSENPYYKMSDAETQALKQANGEVSQATVSSVTVDLTKKKGSTVRGNAAVKETGKLKKHSTDPVSE